jgi:uncharacterized protein YbjT (DUF2867 family)
MILVVGSTGSLGMSVSLKLAAAGKPVSGLVRDLSSTKARILGAAGVSLIKGDLKTPASLASAALGADTIVCTASSTFSRAEGDSIETVDRLGVQSLIAAAESAGVRNFIFVSFASDGMTYPLARAKQQAERRLRESKFNWTILQPACFCETWLSPKVGFDIENGHVRMYGTGTKPVNYIALDDVAKAVVGAIDNPAASHRVFRIGGSSASQMDAVHLVEELTGKPLTIERMSIPEIMEKRSSAKDPLEISFLGLFEQVARGFPAESDWRSTLGVEPQTLESWLRKQVSLSSTISTEHSVAHPAGAS